MDALTVSDVNILIKAVDDWVNSETMDSMLFGIMATVMVSGGSPKDVENAKKVVEKNINDAHSARTQRAETGILLKAKLLKLRDSIEVADASNEIGGTPHT